MTFHELHPIVSIPSAIGNVEAWADREKRLVVRNGNAIIPLSIVQAQEIMQALSAAMKALPYVAAVRAMEQK
jgi:hypothetical protein